MTPNFRGRAILASLAVAALACLAATPTLADWDKAALDRDIAAIEKQAKGRLGVALLDLKDRKSWSHRGSESFPMQSVFKLPLAVAVLQAVEAGRFRSTSRSPSPARIFRSTTARSQKRSRDRATTIRCAS